jgi:hypothetical protein
VSRQIIKVERDLADGIVLSSNDKWLIEDVCEAVARVVSAKALVALAVAINEYKENDIASATELDLARQAISQEVGNKSIILARLLPFEILSLSNSLQRTLEQSA